MPRIEKQLLIVNKLGLHARAAIKLVQLTASYQATVMVSNGEKEASADSVMGLLMLEAAQGQAITVICEGSDANALMSAVEQLVADRFDESE
ncbi:HPr family phosphocarrier protein [Pseudaeromonas sharmana]|uniref:HPr family phosphocarrier protein n=1 Tax=Pseudaeromonas sharmana TaxID=328412 RepID=A0ABV8CNH4_9GAMM